MPATDVVEFLMESPAPWQMRFGERYALEGLLSQIKPQLAIEIGTAQGGSLRRLAAHSEEVHSFDLLSEVEEPEQFANVRFHVGDSATLLPVFLAEVAEAGRTVDFVLVDGDHSAEGVARDGRALLESNACRNTVVIFHDASNEIVRDGIEALRMEEHPNVALLALDFVPGYVVEGGPRRFEIWNGLALAVLVGEDRASTVVAGDDMFDAARVNRYFRDAVRLDEQLREPGPTAGSPDDELQAGPDPALPPVAESSREADRTSLTGAIDDVPERFVPDEMGSGLVAAEHMARYWLACEYASGRRVLDAGCGMGYGSNMLAEAAAASVVGVDLAEPVLEAARTGAADTVTLVQGDVMALDLDDDAFDLVVCFETIEHVTDPERALDELCRVLAPGGLLIVSSPNRDVYVPGNPHHRHEYLPNELEEALASRLAEVRLLRQHDWIASAIMEDAVAGAEGGKSISGLDVRKLVGREPGSETYTIVLASDVALPPAPTQMALTETMELRRWVDLFAEQDRVLRARQDALLRSKAIDAERRQLRTRLEEAEKRLAGMPRVVADRDAALRRQEDLEEELDWADRSLRSLTASPSWKLTRPLRGAKRVAKKLTRR